MINRIKFVVLKAIIVFVILFVFCSCNSEKSQLTKKIMRAKCPIEYDKKTMYDKFDAVKFGKYYINDVTGKEKEDIEWLVLHKEKDKALLISKYVLFHYPYLDWESDRDECVWADSDIRKYLNDTFYNDAFSEEEKTHIVYDYIKNNPNYVYKTDCGPDTKDKVFCISLDECEEYFGKYEPIVEDVTNGIVILNRRYDSENRRGVAPLTPYGREVEYKGFKALDYQSDFWWRNCVLWYFRTNGKDRIMHSNMHNNGQIHFDGDNVKEQHYCVRPAIWVKLD